MNSIFKKPAWGDGSFASNLALNQLMQPENSDEENPSGLFAGSSNGANGRDFSQEALDLLNLLRTDIKANEPFSFNDVNMAYNSQTSEQKIRAGKITIQPRRFTLKHLLFLCRSGCLRQADKDQFFLPCRMKELPF